MKVPTESGVAGCDKLLVICYGNPLCGDDAVGWDIGRRLRVKKLPARTRIVLCHQLTPDLAEPVSQVGRVVFVDARLKGRPGDITCIGLVPGESLLSPFGHTMTPPTLLALSRWLYGKAPAARLYSVVGSRFKPGDVFSQEVERALPTLVSCVWDALTATAW